MTDNEYIIKCLHNASLILKDNRSFIYLMSERASDMQKYDLGKGSFVTAISLFSLLNFISKIFAILKKGDGVFKTETDIEEYEKLKKVIQSKPELEWSKFKKYFIKPRLGDINELDAFVLMIELCPIYFGIDKNNKEQIEEIWRNYRNKLTHIISLKGEIRAGQMLINEEIQPSGEGMYLKNLDFIKSRLSVYKPFDITSEETKEVFSKKIDLDSVTLQHIIKDKCYVERLTLTSQMLLDWIIEEIDSNQFSRQNSALVVQWLKEELQHS